MRWPRKLFWQPWLVVLLFALPVSGGQAEMAPAFRDCPDCPLMQLLPGGILHMGPTEHEQYVSLTESIDVEIPAFAIGVYEVTFAEWDACLADGGCLGHMPRDRGDADGNYPVWDVTRPQAEAFVTWLNERTDGGYRLPSESEWEYAARAGTDTMFWWGDEASHEFANYGRNDRGVPFAEGRDQWLGASPVGSFPPNPFGLFDMNGNVFEWTSDCYSTDITRTPRDSTPMIEPDCRMLSIRGGSYHNAAFLVRNRFRPAVPSDVRSPQIGFRLAKSVTASNSN
jgi:formylglycine-generating enzyme required for sulfatase activity